MSKDVPKKSGINNITHFFMFVCESVRKGEGERESTRVKEKRREKSIKREERGERREKERERKNN